MGIKFRNHPDATSFADIERSLGLDPVTDFGPRETIRDVPDVIEPEEPPDPPNGPPPTIPFTDIPLPPIVQAALPFFPDLPDIEDLIDSFMSGIGGALAGIPADIEATVLTVIDKITNPIDTLQQALDVVSTSVLEAIDENFVEVETQASRIITSVRDKVDNAFEGTLGVVDNIINNTTTTISNVLDVIETVIAEAITGVTENASEALESLTSITETTLEVIGNKVTQAIAASAQSIEDSVGLPFAKLADVLPFQVASLGEKISEGFGTFLDLPELLGDKIKDVFSELASSLGLDNLVHFTQILQAVFSVSDFHSEIGENIINLIIPLDPIHSASDTAFLLNTLIPMVGGAITLANAGTVERIRQNSLEHERPTLVGMPDGLELLRRFPEEADSVISDLKRGGWSDERIDQLTRLRFQLPPVADSLEAWRRGFLDDAGLEGKLDDLGWSTEDQRLLRRLTFRIPPVQDMILFAIRGVFDVEESRAFGEFEGLPSELEAEFISKFDIEGGDFSRQVEVFATEAQKLGIAPEWVAAYWTSHWRLPSLQTAYQMFHRLQPDILEAEADRVAADGFSVAELEFTRPELDRLVRAQDFSSFWRPKLSAIAFNPLTRVDIRRMHRLGLLDRDAVVRAYRKVGFAPSDAELMTKFTEAFNAEPDQDQAREVRDLTKTVILDFVENSLFTPEEGIERLQSIGYDDFAAEALVDLELAKVERNLQRDQIDLVEEQVKLGILDLNAASIELDRVGVPAAQKEVIIRKLGVQIAPRPATPSKADLDNFLNQRVIDTGDYRLGLVDRGYSDFWIDHYIALDRQLRTKKDLDGLFISEVISLDNYINGLVDLGYSEGTIVQFVTLIEQASAEAKEEEG